MQNMEDEMKMKEDLTIFLGTKELRDKKLNFKGSSKR